MRIKNAEDRCDTAVSAKMAVPPEKQKRAADDDAHEESGDETSAGIVEVRGNATTSRM